MHGVADKTVVGPEAYWLDYALLCRLGIAEIRLNLFGDSATTTRLSGLAASAPGFPPPAKIRDEFAPDSPLEQRGFELQVPP
jgi:hypothetical protein